MVVGTEVTMVSITVELLSWSVVVYVVGTVVTMVDVPPVLVPPVTGPVGVVVAVGVVLYP